MLLGGHGVYGVYGGDWEKRVKGLEMSIGKETLKSNLLNCIFPSYFSPGDRKKRK